MTDHMLHTEKGGERKQMRERVKESDELRRKHQYFVICPHISKAIPINNDTYCLLTATLLIFKQQYTFVVYE